MDTIEALLHIPPPPIDALPQMVDQVIISSGRDPTHNRRIFTTFLLIIGLNQYDHPNAQFYRTTLTDYMKILVSAKSTTQE